MRKPNLILAGVFIVAVQAVAGDLAPEVARKLDPKLRLIVDMPEFARAVMGGQVAFSQVGDFIEVVIKTRGSSEELRRVGVQVQAKVADIVTGSVAREQLSDLASLENVVFVQAARTMRFQNDVAVIETQARTVQQQYGLTGKDIVIGCIDTGIDWRHDDFRTDNGDTRIQYLLDLSRANNTGPYGGTLYTAAQINAALGGTGTVAEVDRNGHGSHVTGTAAGNGRANGGGIPVGTYAGMASEADIVFVKTKNGDTGNISENDAINGMHFIDSVATVLGKPYVMNLSFGNHDGAHDGTSMQEQVIDVLVGPGRFGKVIVAAAGNNGNDNLHAGGTASGGTIELEFEIPSYTPNPGTQNDFVLFSVWYDGNLNLSFTVVSPAGRRYGPINSGGRFAQDTNDGAVIIDNASGGINPLNGDKEVVLQCFDFSSTTPPSGKWKVQIAGGTGRYDLWLHNTSMGAQLTTRADNAMTVTIPGTAHNVITVGAWVTKRSWTDLDANNLFVDVTVGSIAAFSGIGPTRDGRTKPDFAAPGQMIGSTLSADAPPNGQFSEWKGTSQFPNAYILRDNRHAIGSGTSFASPSAAGGIALMLQLLPRLDAIQAQEALTGRARADGFTGNVPNMRWGYGKVDFAAALDLATVIDSDKPSQPSPAEYKLSQNFPNPFNPETWFEFEIPQSGEVRIEILSPEGRRVRLLTARELAVGRHRLRWDGKDDSGTVMSSGIYLYRLQVEKFVTTRKMLLVR